MNKNLNAQFDIIDETINLMNEAAAEVRKLTFAEGFGNRKNSAFGANRKKR